MGAVLTNAAAHFAPLLPELKLQTRIPRLMMMPADEVHRFVLITDGRKLGMGISASVYISAFYMPISISLWSDACTVSVGLGDVNPPVGRLDAELVKQLRGEPMRLLQQGGTAFGLVDYLRGCESIEYPAGMFEYGMALARAGALHEAGRRLLEFMSMDIPPMDLATHRLLPRAQEMLNALYERDSRRDALFERWILEGKRGWGLIPDEEEEDEAEDDDLGELGEWEPGSSRW